MASSAAAAIEADCGKIVGVLGLRVIARRNPNVTWRFVIDGVHVNSMRPHFRLADRRTCLRQRQAFRNPTTLP